MQEVADDPAIINPRLNTYILGQRQFDPLPLFVVQPKQIAPQIPLYHESALTSESSSIQTTTFLSGFDPNDQAKVTIASYRYAWTHGLAPPY